MGHYRIPICPKMARTHNFMPLAKPQGRICFPNSELPRLSPINWICGKMYLPMCKYHGVYTRFLRNESPLLFPIWHFGNRSDLKSNPLFFKVNNTISMTNSSSNIAPPITIVGDSQLDTCPWKNGSGTWSESLYIS